MSRADRNRRTRVLMVVEGLALIGALAGCEAGQDPIITSPVQVRARRDDGVSVAGVAVRINDILLGSTDGRGEIKANLSGPDGAIFRVQASCPEGFDSPAEVPPIVLGKFASLTQKDGSLDLTIHCERQRRMAAILVRARFEKRKITTGRRGRSLKRVESSEGIRPVGGLSVMVNGRERARTDANGLAHLSMEAAPGSHIEVGLQTSTPEFASFSPRSPAQGLNLRNTDDFYTVDQMFTEEQVIAPPPPPKIRKRIDVIQQPQHNIRLFDGGDDSPALIHFK